MQPRIKLRGRPTRLALPLLALCCSVSSSALATETDALNTVSSTRGAALFDGREPLSGTIRGHTSPMPAGMLSCSTCHAGPPSRPAGISDVPALDATDLLTQKVRRNGPPSAYGPETFCRVVRTGVDPVYVLVARSMPVFTVSPQQCASLWLYLMDRTSP